MKYFYFLMMLVSSIIGLVLAQCEPCSLQVPAALFPTSGQAVGVAFSPNGTCLAVTNVGTNTVSMFVVNPDCSLSKIPQDFPTDLGPVSVAFSPNGTCLAVANRLGNSVTMFSVDSTTCQLDPIGTFPTGGSQAESVAFSSNGQCLAVANSASSNVSMYTVNADCTLIPAVGSPFATGSGSSSVAFSPTGNCLAVANPNSNDVRIFTVNAGCTLTPVGAPVPVIRAIAVAFSPNGNCLAVASSVPVGSVALFGVDSDTCSLTPIGAFATDGLLPLSLAFSPNGTCLAVGHDGSDDIAIFTVNTNCSLVKVNSGIAPNNNFPAPGRPTVAYSPDSQCLAFGTSATVGIGIYRTNRVLVPSITNITAVCTGEVTLQGTTTASSIGFPITVAVSENGTVLSSTVADSVGNFQLALALTPGTHILIVTATNPNDCSASTTVVVTVPAPATTPTISTISTNCNGTLNVTGTADANAFVSVFANGVLSGIGKADGTGAFSFTTSTSLPDGTYTITATSTNTSCCTSSPSAGVLVAVNRVISPTLSTAIAACDGTVTVTGTADPNSAIILYAGLGQGTANGSGTFDFSSTQLLPTGTYDIAVAEVEETCISSPSNTVAVTVNQVAAPCLVQALANCNGTVMVQGVAEPGTTITLFANGTVIGTGTAGASGTFSFTSSVQLPEGTFSITVTATNAADCVSARSNTLEVVVDRAQIPVLANAQADCSGIIRVQGTAEPNATITIFAHNSQIGQGTANAAGSFAINSITPLVDGMYSITVVATNAAGCVSEPSNSLEVVVDRAQVPTLRSAQANCKGIIRVRGTAESNATITVFAGDREIGTGTANNNGNFNFRTTTPLREGTYTITVVATNRAECISEPSNGKEVTVDPAQRLTLEADANCSLVMLTGIAEPRARIVLFRNGVHIGTTTADVSGDFSFVTGPLANGTYTFTAQATNRLGCVRNSRPLQVTVRCEVVITIPSCSITSNSRPTITGQATPGVTVVVFANGILLGRAQVTSTGTFSVTPREQLVDGTYTIVAVIIQRGQIVRSNSIRLVIETQERGALSKALVAKYCPQC